MTTITDEQVQQFLAEKPDSFYNEVDLLAPGVRRMIEQEILGDQLAVKGNDPAVPIVVRLPRGPRIRQHRGRRDAVATTRVSRRGQR